jgi:hypothetical protein
MGSDRQVMDMFIPVSSDLRCEILLIHKLCRHPIVWRAMMENFIYLSQDSIFNREPGLERNNAAAATHATVPATVQAFSISNGE